MPSSTESCSYALVNPTRMKRISPGRKETPCSAATFLIRSRGITVLSKGGNARLFFSAYEAMSIKTPRPTTPPLSTHACSGQTFFFRLSWITYSQFQEYQLSRWSLAMFHYRRACAPDFLCPSQSVQLPLRAGYVKHTIMPKPIPLRARLRIKHQNIIIHRSRCFMVDFLLKRLPPKCRFV